MGLVFSWLWGRRAPLPGVAAETQVSSPQHLPRLRCASEHYVPACSVILHCSAPPSSSPCKPPPSCILSFLHSTCSRAPLGPRYFDPAHGFLRERSLFLSAGGWGGGGGGGVQDVQGRVASQSRGAPTAVATAQLDPFSPFAFHFRGYHLVATARELSPPRTPSSALFLPVLRVCLH